MTGKATAEVAPWVERLARTGYAAKAVLYLTIGYLAARAATGSGGRVTDTEGALRVVHGASFGRVLLLLMAAGLLGYGLWRLVQAVVDPEHRGKDWKGLAVRSGFLARGLFHGALGITAARLALKDRAGGGADQMQGWTEQAFDLPGGNLLVGLAAAWIAGYGVYQLYRASTPKLSKHLRLRELDEPFRTGVVRVSRFGIAARGVVFCLIGLFLARAVLRHDAAEAGGLRESLRTVASWGQWPFVVVAFGLMAYGVYELVNARYRSISIE
jgi:hypothetical protein